MEENLRFNAGELINEDFAAINAKLNGNGEMVPLAEENVVKKLG